MKAHIIEPGTVYCVSSNIEYEAKLKREEQKQKEKEKADENKLV